MYFLSLDFGGIQMQRAFQTMGIQNVPAVVLVNGKVIKKYISILPCGKINIKKGWRPQG